MNIDFNTPTWLINYYNVVGLISLLINIHTMLLIIFKSDKLGNFKYFMLAFQIINTVSDFHVTILMQAVPLFPIWAFFSVGLAADELEIWSHILIAVLITSVGCQFVSLEFCFLKKHQAIAEITRRHQIPEMKLNIFRICMSIWPIFTYILIYLAGMKREVSMAFVVLTYPQYISEFSKLNNFAIYQWSFWFIFSGIVATFGIVLYCIICNFATYDMLLMLKEVQLKVSNQNYKRHRSVLTTLIAQSLGSSVIVVPGFALMVFGLLELGYDQLICEIICMVFSLRGSIHSIVFVLTTPPYRRFIFG
ncbi:Serpentine Receptor, class H [Caenorhabditis elegans]|uniref:Serpentine Receptor, class H n=1 Tax=Caenorhabditis elegans TaxID=6239 RepID=Q95Q38_CAEEL|nr:Serpentine Receptor, class H [Caenorhabditis elegans]CCD64941.1 Serpentine Receptor, class H [Caenorhabditis elegans]|eukprot:NP_494472.2 Serpentine Receptor, class I [Caenorhabditis elegans]